MSRLTAAAALFALLACAPSVARDRPADGARMSVGLPEGFDQLARAQEAVVDVYLGGRAIGQARVRQAPGSVAFTDIDALLALVPDLTDGASVRAALAAPDLDPHAGLVCAADAEPAGCGQLSPTVAGVILDMRRFRLDLFVHPRFRAVHPVAELAYLPPPDAGLSLIDQIGGTIAGSGGRSDYALQNRAILGYRDARVRSELSYSSRFGLLVDTLVAEVDKPGFRYAAGAMWAPGLDLTGRRKIVGAGVQSQTDTRLDRTLIAGSPLVVALAARARVDILRDGRLLISRNYEPGNQTLDTGSLPDGAYDVVLRIQEAGAPPRDERRFFTKNAVIASAGAPIVFAYAGVLANDRRGAVLAPSRTPFYQAGVARRMSAHIALDLNVAGTNRTAILEAGGYWLGRAGQVRAAVLGSIRGDVGLLLQAASSSASRLNYGIDARRVLARGNRPLIPLGDLAFGDAGVAIDRDTRVGAGSFTQVNGSIGYDLRPGQIGLSAFYRDDRRASRSYGIGPSVYVPLFERSGLQISLRGDMTLSNRGRTAFLGISIQRLRGSGSLYASGGARSTAGSGVGSGTALVGGVGGAWQRSRVLGGDLAVSGGVEREVDGTLVRGRADLAAPVASLAADVAQPLAGRNGATQYGLSFQTTAAVARGGIALQGRERNDSVIMVAVGGDATSRGAPFEVLIDNAVRGSVRVGETLSVSVPAYRRYAVRVRSTGEELMHVDGDARLLSVYPGTVARATWDAQRVVAMFGRLVGADGVPVGHAAIRSGDAIGTTDANGWFQIEAGVRAMLDVQAIDGARCRVPLDARPNAQGYAALGSLACVHALPAVRLADSR